MHYKIATGEGWQSNLLGNALFSFKLNNIKNILMGIVTFLIVHIAVELNGSQEDFVLLNTNLHLRLHLRVYKGKYFHYSLVD